MLLSLKWHALGGVFKSPAWTLPASWPTRSHPCGDFISSARRSENGLARFPSSIPGNAHDAPSSPSAGALSVRAFPIHSLLHLSSSYTCRHKRGNSSNEELELMRFEGHVGSDLAVLQFNAFNVPLKGVLVPKSGLHLVYKAQWDNCLMAESQVLPFHHVPIPCAKCITSPRPPILSLHPRAKEGVSPSSWTQGLADPLERSGHASGQYGACVCFMGEAIQ